MNHLDVALAAHAHCEGRALRTSKYRHNRLQPKPIAIILYQLGAEPFAAAAIGWGDRQDRLNFQVAGEPRNRDLAFSLLLDFAKWFNARFEAPALERETVERGDYKYTRALSAPQVLVANSATATMLDRLGRRLAYLPTTGPRPADESLVRLGRHLRFLAGNRLVPGQQLLVSLTDLLNDHWMTSQSDIERQSIAALDAFIEPPHGMHGFHAAEAVEDNSVGPVPGSDDDERLEPLVERFNERRAGQTDLAAVRPLLGPIENHYRPMVHYAWDLLWRCRNRESKVLEAASVERRWTVDREAYTQHIDWTSRNGNRRTRQTPRQAAMTLRRLEEAQKLLEAETACDDPIRMIPYLLQHKAVCGKVIAVDREHRELATKRMVSRPLLTLQAPDPCIMPPGKELWWTAQPDGREFVVHSIHNAPSRAVVTLKLMTSSSAADLPSIGSSACFSVHNTHPSPPMILPAHEPWTHRQSRVSGLDSIETPEESNGNQK
jgi:hypothetical protein